MTEQSTAQIPGTVGASSVGPDAPQPTKRILHRVLAILATASLACLGLVLAYVIGTKTLADEWPILVTGTGLAVFVAIALINPRHALIAWIVVAPFARFVYLNLELGRGIPNLTLNRIMTGVLLVLILAQVATKQRKLARFTWTDLLVLLFAVAAAASVSSTMTPLKSAIQSFFDYIIAPIAIYFLARNLITSYKDLKSVMIALAVIGFYLGFLATREQLTGNVWFYPEDRSIQYTANIRRVVGLLGNPAYIAVTIDMGIPWAWYLLLKAKRGRVWLFLVVGMMTAGVILCMNRSGWIGLLLSLIVMALFVKRFRKVFLIILLIGVVVGAVYWAVIIASPAIQERLKAQGPVDYRVETWDIALRVLRDYPIFGIGYDNFFFYYQRYGSWDLYLRASPTPHNTYLWVALMGGVVALIPFLAFLFTMVGSSLRMIRQGRGAEPGSPAATSAEMAGLFLASMASIFGPAFVMDILSGNYNTMVMFFIMGAFFGAVNAERDRRIVMGRRRAGGRSQTTPVTL